MSDTLPITLDRAMAALASHGVRLRRSTTLTLLATLLGHRSSNEMVAAVARGDLDPPTSTGTLATDGLVRLLDPVANGRFAVERRMLDGTDRGSSYLFSPWGNLIDARPARTGLSAPDGDPTDASGAPRAPASRIDLPRLVREADAMGCEHVDVRSDGVTGRITSHRQGTADTVLYQGDALPVDALLFRIKDDRDEHEHGPHLLNVLGERLEVDGMRKSWNGNVRLYLKAWAASQTLIGRSVHLPFPQWLVIGEIAYARATTRALIAGELVREGLGLVRGDALPAAGEPDRWSQPRHELISVERVDDDEVRALSGRLGVGKGSVVQRLLTLALADEGAVGKVRARPPAAPPDPEFG